ncbi:hypothetical protein ABH930_006334 [Kitasatospora sp. GAS204A]|uniref:hypothetical protein n=1 Tax=unclassified Kitasatospora TaxID=2633591 RepID=UPI002476E546|nr:hypothetical protein [Kitasatospora sp. GAS204B]MDH6122074.1 hypothetical protein [Kitasatospora sp. GAS204B]
MISINSYIRRDANTFEPISLTQTAAANSAYIEGAIELSIDGTGIIGKEAWDYVDQLWSYIVDMATRLRCGQSASSYFPDQPLKLTFQKEPGGNIRVTLESDGTSRSAMASESLFYVELKKAGREFFEKFIELYPENRESYMDSLKELQSL